MGASWLGPAFVLVYWMDCDCGGAKKAGAAGYTLLVTVTGVQCPERSEWAKLSWPSPKMEPMMLGRRQRVQQQQQQAAVRQQAAANFLPTSATHHTTTLHY